MKKLLIRAFWLMISFLAVLAIVEDEITIHRQNNTITDQNSTIDSLQSVIVDQQATLDWTDDKLNAGD